MEDLSTDESMDRLMEESKANASRVLVYASQLQALIENYEIDEANVEKKYRELEVKEKELQDLSLDLGIRCQNFEKEKEEAGNLKSLVDEFKEELKSKSNQLSIKLDLMAKTRGAVELKEQRLKNVQEELEKRCSEACKAEERKKDLEGEVDKRKTELEQILDQIKESGKQFVTVDEQLESKRRQVEIVSSELVSKEKELEGVRESIKLSNSDLELKERKVKLLDNQVTSCVQAIDEKSKQLIEIQRLIEEKTRELGVMHNQHEYLKLLVLEFAGKIRTEVEKRRSILQDIERFSSEMKVKANEVKAAETKASELHARSQLLRQDVRGKETKLELLKNLIEPGERKLFQLKRDLEERAKELKAAESEASDLSSQSERFRQKLQQLENKRWSEQRKLHQLEKESKKENDKNKEVLAKIVSKIEESERQLADVDEKLISKRKLLDAQPMELVSKGMGFEFVTESSKRHKEDLEVKERRVQELSKLIAIYSEQLDFKSKELEQVQKLIEEETKKLCDMQQQQPSAAPGNDTSQHNAEAAEMVDEDALMHFESSESLMPDEVSIALRASPNPAELVLDLVEAQIQEGLDLEDSVLDIFVLMLDELAKIPQPEKSQLQLRATEVATLWKRKMTIKASKSSLWALAFLLFIVEYGLKKLINREETVLLASSIAQYKQAPTLFVSLGLKPEMIPEIVNELIKQSQYLPAVRFICHFKLTRNVSPSDLLMKELTNLRRSILEKRPTGSSQAKDKDAGRLRAILEVVADYKLKIDLPGDLVAKVMVQRESLSSLVHCSVTHHTSSSSPQANTPAQQSGVKLRVPKPEVKPYLMNPCMRQQ